MKLIRIGQSLEMGREVIANQLIPKGTIIENCELLVLNQSDTIKVNETDLKYYTFKYNESQDCLVMGNGEIFNHDDSPNVSYNIVEKDGRKVMQFKALYDIRLNTQLFINYNDDTKVDFAGYIDKNLI